MPCVEVHDGVVDHFVLFVIRSHVPYVGDVPHADAVGVAVQASPQPQHHISQQVGYIVRGPSCRKGMGVSFSTCLWFLIGYLLI